MILRSSLTRTILKTRRYNTSSATSNPIIPYTLTSSSPYVRAINPSSSSSEASSSSMPPSINSTSKLEEDFLLYPDFYNREESEEILKMALWKLDRVDSIRKRRRRRSGMAQVMNEYQNQVQNDQVNRSGLQQLFEGEYGFEEGHYDSVIHHYRETLLSSLPPDSSDHLKSLMLRLYALLPIPITSKLSKIDGEPNPRSWPTEIQVPPSSTLTHLLHLAPHGSILPHVDNLQASGRVIIGLSLGSERIMRLRKKEGEGKGSGWDVRLTSGSVYMQRDTVRYEYEHSILGYDEEGSIWNEQKLDKGHRVSIMIRDAPSQPAKL